jgi:hypothetical protein
VEGVLTMSQPIARAAKFGACFGVVISILVLAYGYMESHIHSPAISDWLIFVACPPSIALMAVDNGKLFLFLFADSIVILANAAWYGFLFAVVARLFQYGG